MKKTVKFFALVLGLILVLLSLFSCNSSHDDKIEDTKTEKQTEIETQSNDIKLTLDNYEDYIELDATSKILSERYGFVDFKCDFVSKGNVHYKYKDVVIIIELKYYDYEEYKKYLENVIMISQGKEIALEDLASPSYDTTISLNLNLSGNAEKSNTFLAESSWYGSHSPSNGIKFSVKEITGTVEEY